MFIDTIDLLRCPNDHEETWLVAAFTKLSGRFIEEGALGCPICSASFAIDHGIAIFSDLPADCQADKATAASEEHAVRLAALLNLVRQGSVVVLEGDDALSAATIADITESRVIAVNPSSPVADTELVSTVRSRARIPLATSSVDGVAARTSKLIDDAARVLRQGGRLVAPLASTLPATLSELARDASAIVAEASGPLIQLSR